MQKIHLQLSLITQCSLIWVLLRNVWWNISDNVSIDIFISFIMEYTNFHLKLCTHKGEKSTLSWFLPNSYATHMHGYLLVSIVLRLHCSSTPPCFLPDMVKGISNTKRRMLWLFSKSVFLSTSSFSSRYGVTCVTWIYAYLESRSLGLICNRCHYKMSAMLWKSCRGNN